MLCFEGLPSELLKQVNINPKQRGKNGNKK